MARTPPKNATDLLIDKATDQQLDLLRVSASINRDIVALLEQLEADIIAQINRYAGKSALTIARLRSLLSVTYKTIADAYRGAAKAFAADLPKVIDMITTVTVNGINDVATADLADVTFKATELKAMAEDTFVLGRQSEEWWLKEAPKLQDKFAVQMRLGMLQGEGVDQLTRRIRGTEAAGYTDGIMSAAFNNAEALVRTSVIGHANAGRLETFNQNNDLIDAIQWVATLDNHTTEICMALDGLTWSLPESGDPEDYGGYEPLGHDKQFPGPTAHWNCRSTQVSVLKSLKELAQESGVSEEDLPDELDGEEGQQATFDDWLGDKSPQQQDDLLGPTLGDMYRRGDLSLSDLTDQQNRPLTVEQLVAKYG